ncbi:MAG: anion permease [Gemmataceae bacterium]
MPYAQISFVMWLLIVLALVFDFLNGMNDAANSIATVVSTRVLTPYQAVAWAAFFNFIAFAFFQLKVAETIGKGIVDPAIVDNNMVAGTLLGASAWTYFCTSYGLPISVSHALIGGLVGTALAKGGFAYLVWSGIIKTVAFIVLAPLLGMFFGLIIAVATTWTFRRSTPRQVENLFRRGQLLSAAFYALGHGGNDAQKTMGIIYVLLLANGALGSDASIPTEVVLSSHLAMGLGTLIGGWTVIRTLGHRLVKLRPVDGFCAESGAAATLLLTMFGGIPASTTHTVTGAIVGVGSARYRLSAVRWGVAGQVIWAWLLTIPGSAVAAAASGWLLAGLI